MGRDSKPSCRWSSPVSTGRSGPCRPWTRWRGTVAAAGDASWRGGKSRHRNTGHSMEVMTRDGFAFKAQLRLSLGASATGLLYRCRRWCLPARDSCLDAPRNTHLRRLTGIISTQLFQSRLHTYGHAHSAPAGCSNWMHLLIGKLPAISPFSLRFSGKVAERGGVKKWKAWTKIGRKK